jgi:hypothetical protein
MNSLISETVSEKPRRGRPKAWHHSPVLDALCPPGRTERGKANWRIAVHVLGTLRNGWEPEFAWFWRHAPVDTYDEMECIVMMSDGAGMWRETVLTEIGRIPGESLRLEVARDVANMPPGTTCREAAHRARYLHDMAAMSVARAMLVAGGSL